MAAAAITTIGSGAPASPDAPTTGVDLGKQAVLVAAKKAAAQPTGKYWHSDVISGRAHIVRAATGNYAITVSHSESFSRHGAKSGTGSAYFQRDLPARPQTARDLELWGKDGSPTSFGVPTDGGRVTFTARAAPWRSEGPASQHADAKIMRVSSLLNDPLPPKVRAGLMRALAAQEGVRPIGRVTDPPGRPGVALAAGDRATTITDGPKAGRGTYRSRTVIIFDERTGALLSRQEQLTRPGGEYAEMKPGLVIEHRTVRSAKWTDTEAGAARRPHLLTGAPIPQALRRHPGGGPRRSRPLREGREVRT